MLYLGSLTSETHYTCSPQVVTCYLENVAMDEWVTPLQRRLNQAQTALSNAKYELGQGEYPTALIHFDTAYRLVEGIREEWDSLLMGETT